MYADRKDLLYAGAIRMKVHLRPSAYIGQFQFSRRGTFHSRCSGGGVESIGRNSRLCRRCACYLPFQGYRFAQPPVIESLRSPVLRTLYSRKSRTWCSRTQYSQRCRTRCSRNVVRGSRTQHSRNVVRMSSECRRKYVDGSLLVGKNRQI